MRLFAQLFAALDESNRTGDKVAALERYFRVAPPADAAWGLWFLMGNRIRGVGRGRPLLESAAVLAGLPLWLAEECYTLVGDLAETLSLLIDCPGTGTAMPLHELVEQHLLPLQSTDDASRIARIHALWMQMDCGQCLVFNKILTGAFRVGASRTLVLRALAGVAGIEAAVMGHRVMGQWQPGGAQFQAFLSAETQGQDPAQPYPFYLASPLEGSLDALGPIEDWQAEWKWDGIRCQIIRRQGQVLLWSRGEELITDAFPELAEAAALLPDGTVLDGEVLAWRDGAPLPFAALQKRLGRKQVGAQLRRESPVAFLAYDCLEHGSRDLRDRPLRERRSQLEDVAGEMLKVKGRTLAEDQQGELFAEVGSGDVSGGSKLPPAAQPVPSVPDPAAANPHLSPVAFSPAAPTQHIIAVSPQVEAAGWQALRVLWETARERGVEGLMLKRRDSPYRAGRVKGDWWKWKIAPLTVDAVVVYAQSGHSKRANLFSDYTFAVWDGRELVPIAKAYSGLSDDELRKVDAWVKRNSVAKHGPVRVVKPELVMEIAFEAIQESSRHRSGIAVRFPRIVRWRRDKKPEEADSMETLRALLKKRGPHLKRSM